jgi:dTDP-4-dehydrorhamnose reductase
LRALSSEIGATPIYISTDYVFDGTKTKPYTEKDQPNPINTYGISKLAGELYTKQTSTHYIIRISSLFGTAGANGKGGKRARNSKPQRKNRIKCGVRSK